MNISRMKLITTLICILLTSALFGQTFDSPLSHRKMKKDLDVFKSIRAEANSGLNKYRTKKETDYIYTWAEQEIPKLNTYGEFYNLITLLTNFEGSVHNETYLPKETKLGLKSEKSGYFPYPLKWIDGALRCNLQHALIPLGSEIISINGADLQDIVPNLYPFYTTDGFNTSGKMIGINYHFSKYYRMQYGNQDNFTIEYIVPNTSKPLSISIKSVGYKAYYTNVKKRYSLFYDHYTYKDFPEDEQYTYKQIDESTAVLTVNTFGIGDDENHPKHKTYVAFLDRVFTNLKTIGINNLIVDIRENGGGTDPNDLETYSYLTQRPFQENKQAWISFNKIPYIKHFDSPIPKFLRPFGVGKFNKLFQKAFPVEKDGKFYQDSTSKDHQIRYPKPNAFTGQIYLLISPSVASAGSLFGAMVAGNANTISVGEESSGGYYGHNGHTSFTYVLPKSKIKTSFSVVNLEQDVLSKPNQQYTKGIIPDYKITQSYSDYLEHKDTQMDYVLELIRKHKTAKKYE